MASLQEIMREQEDEKLARQLYSQNAYDKEEEQQSGIGDEELARRLQEQYGGYIEQHMQPKEEKQPVQEETDEELARRLQEEFDRIDNAQQGTEHNNDETAAQVDPAEFSLEDDETAALQYEEDERLAYEMQNMERSEVMNVHPRQFNAVEQRYASLKPMHFDEDGEEPDDEYYQEPESAFGLSSKMCLNTYRAKKKTNQTGKLFPVKETGFEYGVILGEFHTHVYCYDGIVRRVYFFAKVRKGAPISRGALALLQLRPLPDRTADAVYIYEEEEVSRLYEMGEITQLDPVLHLPPEVLCLIVEYASSGPEATSLNLLSKGWKDVVAFANRQNDELSRLEWGNLQHFYNRFVYNKLVGEVHGSQLCGHTIIPSMGDAHYIMCGLAKHVVRVAEQVWNELMTWRGQPCDKRYCLTDLLYYFDVRVPYSQYRNSRLEFTYVRYKFDDDELINYASTVLLTWWTIHKRKDLEQRPETIEGPIRTTLLRFLRLGISTALKKYERNLIDLNGALTGEQQLQMKAFQQRWQPVLNPTTPIEDLDEESLSIDELLLYE